MKITVVPSGPSAGIYFETEQQLRDFLQDPLVRTKNDIGLKTEVKTCNGLKLVVGQPYTVEPVTRILELDR
jgi:hypothetical protein